MTTNQKIGLGVGLALAAFVAVFFGSSGHVFGLASVNGYEAGVKWFGNGIYAGLSQQFSLDKDGNATTSGQLGTTGTFQVGSSGTVQNQQNGGFCDLNFGTTTSAWVASTTKTVDCQGTNMLASASATQSALTGVSAWSATSGQRVRVLLASSTPSTYLGVWVNGCSASSTAGYITCSLTNGTGASITPATTTTHFSQYWVDK